MEHVAVALYPDSANLAHLCALARAGGEDTVAALTEIAEAVDRSVQTETRVPDASKAWDAHGGAVLGAALAAKGFDDPAKAKALFARLCVAFEYDAATPAALVGELALLAEEESNPALAAAADGLKAELGAAPVLRT